MKREIPLAITFIAGVLLVIALFVPHSPFGNLESRFNDWYIIVAGFTMILGIDSLLLHHYRKISRKKSGWPYSIALIVSFAITLFWGFYSGTRAGSPFAPASSFLKYFYSFIFVPLQSTMFALLSFFIASAAYRAFRATRFNATLLLIAAGLVMIGRVPQGRLAAPYLFGAALLIGAIFIFRKGVREIGYRRLLWYIFGFILLGAIYPLGRLFLVWLPDIAGWIMNVPQLAAKRGIFIGVALGSIAMSMRIILGIERGYLR